MVKKKKMSIKKAARLLADIIEPHLAKMPQEERERRIGAFESTISHSRKKRSKASSSEHTPGYRVSARGHSE